MSGAGSKAVVSVYTSGEVPSGDKAAMESLVAGATKGTSHLASIWKNIKLTNEMTAGKAAKFGAGLVVGGKVATEFGALTPLRWMIKGFGPLPAEFTRSGAIQVFEFTTLERALLVGKAMAAKFVLVTIAYEGGVVVGSVINEFLPENAKDAIGGTINEIVNEGGWKLLWEHPFGIGM